MSHARASDAALQLQQQAERPPAQPAYVLRGHAAQIHAVRFVRHNARLLTGDADGWIVLWNIATKRPAAVWRAHQGAILGFDSWGEENLITQGRDFHLRVWQLRPEDEKDLSTALPVDETTTDRKQPWLLHSLRVNTLNFCSFAMCPELSTMADATSTGPSSMTPVLVAVLGSKDDEVNIYQLPSERRVSIVPSLGQKTGMTMALSLICSPALSKTVYCISAYESGATAVHAFDATANTWSRIYTSQPHSQPILSLFPCPVVSAAPELAFFTSGADDIVAKHVVQLSTCTPPEAGPPPAAPTQSSSSTTENRPKSLLSAALASQTPEPSASASTPPQPNPAPVAPAKVSRTKHSGQQSLTVRSDGRILATAGWDGRIRVYSAKSLKEVAVLAWHKEGCYAVGFADVGAPGGDGAAEGRENPLDGKNSADRDDAGVVVKINGETPVARTTVRSRREERARAVHWVAAGSKDGKVSLWEVF